MRVIDYRIEYLNRDGTWTSSEKLPFDWRRLTDDDKERMVDSLRVVRQQAAATQYANQMIRWVNMYARDYPRDYVAPEGYVLPPGLPKDWLLPYHGATESSDQDREG